MYNVKVQISLCQRRLPDPATHPIYFPNQDFSQANNKDHILLPVAVLCKFLDHRAINVFLQLGSDTSSNPCPDHFLLKQFTLVALQLQNPLNIKLTYHKGFFSQVLLQLPNRNLIVIAFYSVTTQQVEVVMVRSTSQGLLSGFISKSFIRNYYAGGMKKIEYLHSQVIFDLSIMSRVFVNGNMERIAVVGFSNTKYTCINIMCSIKGLVAL